MSNNNIIDTKITPKKRSANEAFSDKIETFSNETEAFSNKTNEFETMSESDLELKEFECPRCNKKFGCTMDLFAHMRQTYSTPTICHICNKNLNALPNILSHSYIHKNMKPYKCPKADCNYESRTRFNLKVHLGSCAGIKAFQCRRRLRKKRKIKTEQVHSNSNNDRNWMIKPMFMNEAYNIHTPNYDILNEIHDSGPHNDTNRDDTYLIIIHKDYIPPRHSQIVYNTDFFYNNCNTIHWKIQHSQYNDYIDDIYNMHYTMFK